MEVTAGFLLSFIPISADAHMILGTITERDYTCDTPDGRPRDIDSAYDRMARVVLCDIEELGKDRAYEISEASCDGTDR